MSIDIPGHVRTLTPMWVGMLVTWLAEHLDIVIDNETATSMKLVAASAVMSVYYAVARQLEARMPGAGRLLGIAKQPSYDG